VERSDRAIFRTQLRATKTAGMKARLQSIAYLDDDGNVDTARPADDNDGDGEERDL
jgi:hypothetical protein